MAALRVIERSERNHASWKAAYVSGASRRPPKPSLEHGYLPLGIAQNVKLKGDIEEGQRLKWSDVAFDETDLAVRTRREMEAAFARSNA